MQRSNILGFAIGPVGVALFGFITLPLLAWVFTPEDVGRLSLFQVTIALAVIFFSLGLDQAYAREFFESQDKSSLLKTVVVAPALLLAASVLVIYFFFPKLLSLVLFGMESTRLGLYVIGCVVASLVTRFLSVSLRLQDRGVAYSLVQIAPRLLFLAAVAGGALFGAERTLKLLLLSQLLASMAALLLAVYLSRQSCLSAMRASFEFSILAPMLAFGGPLIVGGLMSWALFSMDRFMLRGMSTYEQLAIYSVSSDLAKGATLFSGIFTTIWWPQVYKWVATGTDLSAVDRTSDQILGVSVLVVGLIGLSSWIVGFLLPLEYSKVPYLLVGCVAAPLFYLISEINVVGINISRRTVYLVLSSVVAAVVNLAGNYWLIPKFGASGAAIATVGAFFSFLVIRTEFSRILWRSFNRAHTYIWSIVLSGLSISYMLKGQGSESMFAIIWIILILVAFYRFRGQYKQIYNFARYGNLPKDKNGK